MDKAEAIERLEYLKARAQIALEQEMPDWIAEDVLGTIEAYDMAIEALQTEPSIDIVRCKECKHRTYCYGDVLWTNKRQTVDIHKTVDFCSFGEREGE